jgi:tRNA threonylcarbamoyladenosine biosynthesis protein TsaE
MEYITTTEGETEALAETLAARLKPGDVLAFRGGLGAGKTAFVRGLARGLGVSGQVSSPTFALVHEYGGAVPLYHFDMYRVEDWQSLYSTGFFDYLDSGGILAVEWSENIENALPEGTITITIETLGGDTRRITWEE